MTKRLAVVFPLVIGCSDAAGPSAAVHFDQLYRQTCQLAVDSSSRNGMPDPGNPNFPRCVVLAIVVAATASGAEPSSIQVATASGNQTWRAIVVAETDTASDGSVIDSSFSLVAYSDTRVTTAVVAQYAGTSTGFVNFGSAIYTSAPVTASSSGGPVAFSTLSIASPCRDAPGLINPFGADTGNYMPIEYAPSMCRLATFRAQMAGTFETSGLDSAFRTIGIVPQSVNGIRVLNHPVAQ